MVEDLDIAAIIAALISGGFAIFSLLKTRGYNKELEELKNRLEMKKDEFLIIKAALLI